MRWRIHLKRGDYFKKSVFWAATSKCEYSRLIIRLNKALICQAGALVWAVHTVCALVELHKTGLWSCNITEQLKLTRMTLLRLFLKVKHADFYFPVIIHSVISKLAVKLSASSIGQRTSPGISWTSPFFVVFVDATGRPKAEGCDRGHVRWRDASFHFGNHHM